MKSMTMEKLGMAILFPAILTLFDTPNTNVTTDSGLSDEMKTFYSDYLIDNAEPNLVHDQFGQKHPIPKNGGKNIEFRKYDPLATITNPLTEGVTPAGQKLEMGVVTATVKQYGGYVELSDMLIWTAIDNNMMIATELLGSQAGRTLDTITREVLVAGTVVQYAEGQVSSRNALAYTDESDNMNLTVKAIRMAVRSLRVQNAMPFEGGYFVANMKQVGVFVMVLFLLLPPSSAHPGKTDANGGHYNRSTGEYHYHHGFPEHQHENGICPYDYEDKTEDSHGRVTITEDDDEPTHYEIPKPDTGKEEKGMNISGIATAVLLAIGLAYYLFFLFGWVIGDIFRFIKKKIRPR